MPNYYVFFQESKTIIEHLRLLNWLDFNSQALIVNINLFTPSKDLITALSIIFEWTPEGPVHANFSQLHTTKLLLYANDYESYVFFAEVKYIIHYIYLTNIQFFCSV